MNTAIRLPLKVRHKGGDKVLFKYVRDEKNKSQLVPYDWDHFDIEGKSMLGTYNIWTLEWRHTCTFLPTFKCSKFMPSTPDFN